MNGFLYGCASLTTIDLSNFGGNNLSSITGMFSGCTGLTSINMSNFNFNTASLADLFKGLSVQTIDFSGVNVSNVSGMQSMFSDCINIEKLDLSSFSLHFTSGAAMANMFNGCTSLRRIYVSNQWDASSQYPYMPLFTNCTSLVGQAANTAYSFDSSKVDKNMAVIATDSTEGYLTDISLKPAS